jgi:hypothetical protein
MSGRCGINLRASQNIYNAVLGEAVTLIIYLRPTTRLDSTSPIGTA